MTDTVTDVAESHLRRCVELATQALESGDDPFGSVLTSADGAVLHEARNRERSDADPTAHPELELVRWAIAHLTRDQRAASVIYTSGEHCPMCAAAHGWAGLGPVVAAASARQLAQWRASWGLPESPVTPMPMSEVAPGVRVIAPVSPFDTEVRELHRRASARTAR